jgi:hypothetical protein
VISLETESLKFYKTVFMKGLETRGLKQLCAVIHCILHQCPESASVIPGFSLIYGSVNPYLFVHGKIAFYLSKLFSDCNDTNSHLLFAERVRANVTE